jgi:hypothetical protein
MPPCAGFWRATPGRGFEAVGVDDRHSRILATGVWPGRATCRAAPLKPSLACRTDVSGPAQSSTRARPSRVARSRPSAATAPTACGSASARPGCSSAASTRGGWSSTPEAQRLRPRRQGRGRPREPVFQPPPGDVRRLGHLRPEGHHPGRQELPRFRPAVRSVFARGASPPRRPLAGARTRRPARLSALPQAPGLRRTAVFLR